MDATFLQSLAAQSNLKLTDGSMIIIITAVFSLFKSLSIFFTWYKLLFW